MNLTGQRVTHILPNGKPGRYGTGTILGSQDNNASDRICVKFDNEEEVKTFFYPDCFGQYLQLENAVLEKDIEDAKKECQAADRYRKPEKPKFMKQTEDLRKGSSVKRQERNDSMEMTQITDESTSSILNELDNMIGLDRVKRDVHMLTSFIQVNNMRLERGLRAPVISKHLVLTGNPGTGKTTVARMIARIFYSIGAIRMNKIVETSRAGLVAGYVGQTAIKTQEVINSALGGVLFIDEAYSLANGSKNDFGMEAIDTLLSAMENRRDDLVVIVAGYEDRMKKFIDANPGLASRFNRYIHFEDYSCSDLMAIFLSLCKENEYTLQKDAEKHVAEYINNTYEHRGDEFGNARTVRNIFETIIAHQAERITTLTEVDDDSLMELTLSDIENAINVA